MKKNLLVAICLFASFSFAQVTVQVSAPLANSTVASPLVVQATASSAHPITGWQVYLDNADVYSGPAVATINTSLSASQGAHQLVIRAWDSTGAYGSMTVATTVSSAAVAPPAAPPNALPTPPPTAKVVSNIEQITAGWASCNTLACSGGSGAGTFWQAFDQGSPSLSGRSMEIFNDGAWGDALWYLKTGADGQCNKFSLGLLRAA